MANYKVSVCSLVLMTVSAVDNIRNLPSIAIFGKQILFFYLIAACFFFIPCALVAAQLSSGSNTENGVYHWVKKAFGPQWGLMAVWLQWVETLIFYPTLLAFVAGTIGHYFSPSLTSSPTYLMVLSITCFYLITAFNLYGIKMTTFLSNLSAIFGLLLPMTVIILLGIYWYLIGNPISDSLQKTSFIPNLFEFNSWIALTSIMLSLCGVEVATVHAGRAKNPKKNYPKALLLSTIIILITLVSASLAIATVVSFDKLNFVSGIAQALEIFLRQNNISNLLGICVICVVMGSLGSLNNWLLTPIRGLLEAARENVLPASYTATNKYNVPVKLTIIQAVVVTLICSLFHYFPTINAAYWFLTAVASQLYMLMYLLMFAAYLKLRNLEGYQFKIPGSDKLKIIITLFGMLGCVATILIGFIPLKGNSDPILYGFTIASILLFIIAIPIIYFASRKADIKSEAHIISAYN